MQGVSIAIDARDVDRLLARLAAAGREPTDDLMAGLAAAGVSATHQRIEQGGPDPDGRPWPEVRRSGPPPLNLTGHLKDSIVDAHTARSARWGTNLVYARTHQFGRVIEDLQPRHRQALAFEPAGLRRRIVRRRVARIEIPARPYLGFGAEERALAEAVIRRWLDRALTGKAGAGA